MQANAGMKDALARVKRRITGDVAMKVETICKGLEGSDEVRFVCGFDNHF